MRKLINSLALGAALTVCLVAFGPSSAFAAEGDHNPGHGTVHGGTNTVATGESNHQHHQEVGQQNRTRDDGRTIQRGNGDRGIRQGPPIFERDPDGDRGRGGDWGRDGRGNPGRDQHPDRPVFVPGHDRDHPYRGHYAPPAGFAGRDEWIDVRGVHHAGHFYCSPGWRPTAFFFYPDLGYWIDPVTGIIVYSAPTGFAPYTMVVNETVYEEVWDPILGQWVTVPQTVTYYYTAVWYPAVGLYGYTDYSGVVVYVQ